MRYADGVPGSVDLSVDCVAPGSRPDPGRQVRTRGLGPGVLPGAPGGVTLARRDLAALLAMLLLALAAWPPTCSGVARATGTWPTDGIGICAGPGEQGRTGMLPDGSGGIIVTWRDARAITVNDVFALRITASGEIAPGWPACGVRLCTAPGNQDGGMAVSDGHCGAIVFWEDDRSTPTRVYAQRVSGEGTVLWDPAGVGVCSADSEQAGVSAIADWAGGAILVWHDTRRAPPPGPLQDYPNFDLFAQRLSPTGTRLWDAVGVPVFADSGSRVGGVGITDGAGGAIVRCVDNLRVATFAQRLDSTGSRRWGPNGRPSQSGLMISDGAGGAFIAWSEGRYGPDNSDVWLHRVDSEGQFQSPPGGFPVCTSPFNQVLGSIASDGAGGVFLTWYDVRNGHDWDIYSQRMLASGAVARGWPVNGIPVCTGPDFQIYPAIVSDGTGGAIITWYDHRNLATGYDVYAQHITSPGAIAAGWPTNGVALCTAPGEQVGPVPVTDGAGGMIAYWDDYRGSDVDIYAQHIRANGTLGTIPTGVDIPPQPSMALEAPRPNPTAGELFVSFSLSNSGSARLALFDIAGREVLSRDLSSLGPGRHVFNFDVASMRSGAYELRLTREGRSLTRRVLVVH